MENKYMIKDWAGNVLDFKGSFKLPEFAVPMEFQSFWDAMSFLNDRFPDHDSLDDYFVEEIK